VPYDLAVQPLGKFDEVPEKLGASPTSVELSKLQGKMLRVSRGGKVLQHWIFPEDSGGSIEIVLGNNLEEQLSSPDEDPKKPTSEKLTSIEPKDGNVIPRLLLQAYQALIEQDYARTRAVSEQIIGLSPQIAAPHILIGLSHLQEGDKKLARASFAKAKTLDPGDNSIDTLIKETSS